MTAKNGQQLPANFGELWQSVADSGDWISVNSFGASTAFGGGPGASCNEPTNSEGGPTTPGSGPSASDGGPTNSVSGPSAFDSGLENSCGGPAVPTKVWRLPANFGELRRRSSNS